MLLALAALTLPTLGRAQQGDAAFEQRVAQLYTDAAAFTKLKCNELNPDRAANQMASDSGDAENNLKAVFETVWDLLGESRQIIQERQTAEPPAYQAHIADDQSEYYVHTWYDPNTEQLHEEYCLLDTDDFGG